MRVFLTTAAILTGLAVAPVQAAEPAALTYEIFEASVPHIDLETCPEALPQENAFCRASILHEEIHVFVFSLDGDSPMIGFKSFEAAGVEELLN